MEKSRPVVALIGTRGYPSYYGGFETLVRHLAPYLVDKGWRVRVYCRPGAIRADDPARDPRVEVVTTWGRDTKSLSTLSFGLSACWHALWHHTDVALVMNVANGFWLPGLRLWQIPVVTNVDGIEWSRAKWGRVAKLVFKIGARLTALFSNTLVFDAHAIARSWKKDFHRTGIMIPYGGDFVGELPVEEGLTSGEYALIVARLVPENTISEFLEAALIIAATRDVVIVGSSGYGGEMDEEVTRLAAANPRIHALGHVSDDQRLYSLWQHAGAYFHGHSVGGTNPALVQAMACGAPIVARDTVYNREVLGEAGVFVPPDSRAIADSMLAVMADSSRRQSMVYRSRERAREVYSWQQVNSSYDQALRRLTRHRI